MSILGRIRVIFLERELAALKREGRTERDQVRTTDDMMDNMVARAQRIVEIEHEIGKLKGDPDEGDDSSMSVGFDTKLPSDFGIPTPEECKREGIKWPTSTRT